MNKRRWLDHTIYRIYRDDSGILQADILTPTSQSVTIFTGPRTPQEIVAQVKDAYGEDTERLPSPRFQEELERRITHSESILAMLQDNWTGQDLSGWHLYASILRPMYGIKIDNTVVLNGNNARYRQYKIHDYVVSLEPLDEQTREHYTLVTISHP